MIRFAVIRTVEGHIHCLRLCDVTTYPKRDTNYGWVELPDFESETIGRTIMAEKLLSPEQCNVLRGFAAPLFPERADENKEGEGWKE